MPNFGNEMAVLIAKYDLQTLKLIYLILYQNLLEMHCILQN